MAAFDLDGTLTRADTLLPFLRQARGDGAVLAALVRAAPWLTGAALGLVLRDTAKQRLLRPLLRGRDAAWLETAGARFASGLGTSWLRTDTVARLDEHRGRGDHVVIVTASLEVYARPLGVRLGADAVLATRMASDARGRLTGELDGANCRGEEKARRLRAWLGTEPRGTLSAYGDSAGDDAMLALADHAVRVPPAGGVLQALLRGRHPNLGPRS